jgi:radical SAM-linked protein
VSDAPTTPPAPEERRESRQRWRLVLARDPVAPSHTQREVAAAWETAIRGSGLPLAWSEGATPRPKISFGAPLPVGMAAERELIDLVITERWPAWRVREAIQPAIPDGWRMTDLEDVWLGGPPLAGRVAAADYRITLGDDGGVGADALRVAATDLLAARHLSRERAKGGGTVAYDLRPLLIDVRVADDGPPIVLVTRTRIHPELGSGRPEEVVAALGASLGVELRVGDVVRERLLLADELDLD